jgi:hypothetical protein
LRQCNKLAARDLTSRENHREKSGFHECDVVLFQNGKNIGFIAQLVAKTAQNAAPLLCNENTDGSKAAILRDFHKSLVQCVGPKTV